MRYPEMLKKGDKIGINAPSLGVEGEILEMLKEGIHNLNQLGFECIETESVRHMFKGTSAAPVIRAKEFMDLYIDDNIKGIIAARGGEFLMDMLPYLDYEKIKNSAPKWIVGFSDISTLLFALTTKCDISTAHGPIVLHFSGDGSDGDGDGDGDPIDESAPRALKILQGDTEFEQHSIGCFEEEFADNPYWRLLSDKSECEFSGRLIGGGMDTIRSLIGTAYAPVSDFIEKYKNDGFIWYLESCSMRAEDIYKTLWQMKMNGWFKHCNGVLYGRPDGYEDYYDFTLTDALSSIFSENDIPVIYNVDVGHIHPQLTFINGAMATVKFKDSKGSIIQKLI